MTDAVRYVDDSAPGITRIKKGKGWCYYDERGRKITRLAEIDRLDAIALPPAYADAWFCPKRDGHIQAVGWDAKGRKQYRYHTAFRSAREADKYARCADFGMVLPAIRNKVETDLSRVKIDRDTTIAAVVRLLDRGSVRVGNESYARANKSYGATTLRKRHAHVKGKLVLLEYVGKSGIIQSIRVEDKRLARVVRRCLDQSHLTLFEYVEANGERHAVTSNDVNQYMRDASGADFTAKDFRTWGASVIALEALLLQGSPSTMKAMLEPVAASLGNTPAIARKSYIHPAVIMLIDTPRKIESLRASIPRKTRFLCGTERALLKLLGAKNSVSI